MKNRLGHTFFFFLYKNNLLTTHNFKIPTLKLYITPQWFVNKYVTLKLFYSYLS